MPRFRRTRLLSLSFVAVSVHATGLPDTGQSTCYSNAAPLGMPASDPVSIARDTGTYPRQDCRYGRDAAAAVGALPKAGAGAKGFDYTKIANNGTTLAAGATLGTAAADWACTKDNITGLTWEVKSAVPGDLRQSVHTYTWYNSDGSTNGGTAGSTGSNTCNTTLPGSLCNTQAFTTAVNTATLCTYTDWRLPTRRELSTLVYYGPSPSIDPTYFPNTIASWFWSGSSYGPLLSLAWIVEFSTGDTNAYNKGVVANYVRLVRGELF